MSIHFISILVYGVTFTKKFRVSTHAIGMYDWILTFQVGSV